MSLTVTAGWWMLPVVIALVGAGWVFWPRPEEWEHGDYSVGSGVILAPLRIAAVVILTLIGVVIWRW